MAVDIGRGGKLQITFFMFRGHEREGGFPCTCLVDQILYICLNKRAFSCLVKMKTLNIENQSCDSGRCAPVRN